MILVNVPFLVTAMLSFSIALFMLNTILIIIFYHFREIPSLIAQHMSDLGGEVSYHKFEPQLKKFHPLHFFTSPDPEIAKVNVTCSSYAVNTVGIIRAPRGDSLQSC